MSPRGANRDGMGMGMGMGPRRVTHFGELGPASSGAALGLCFPSRRVLRCCNWKAGRRGAVGRTRRGTGAPWPKPHLLGLQEVGVPQLADNHLTLLKRGWLAQVWRQAHRGGLLALVLATCCGGGHCTEGLHFFISGTVTAAAQSQPPGLVSPPTTSLPGSTRTSVRLVSTPASSGPGSFLLTEVPLAPLGGSSASCDLGPSPPPSSSCAAALSPDPTSVGLVERESKDGVYLRKPALQVVLPRGQRGLHFGCKVQAPCCAPGKSQKLRCQPWSCSSLLAPCALQRPSTVARVSPRTRPTVLLVKSQVSLSRFCEKMVSGLLLAPSCGLRAAQGPCRLPRERGKAVPTRWASLERVCFHSGYWPIWLADCGMCTSSRGVQASPYLAGPCIPGPLSSLPLCSRAAAGLSSSRSIFWGTLVFESRFLEEASWGRALP